MLTPDVLEDVISRAIELYRSEPDAAEERHERLTSEAARLRTELSHYAEAIASGGGLASILDAMRTRERRLAEIKTLLEHLDDLAALSRPRTGEALTREIRARLANWAVLVGQQPAVAWQILRKRLVGRLRLTPKTTEGGRWYEFSGKASYGALLKGSVVVMVPPEGFARLAQQPIEILIAA